MKILDVVQGSPEWLTVRAKHFCASDAPAMMGASKYTSRDELLRQKATGHIPDVDPIKQALYDRGHEAEAGARPLIEAYLGEELYPATATDDGGRLLASYDGLTMDNETGYEHKLWNVELAAQVRNGGLSPMYYWQLEHQCLVGNLKRVIFVCSDGMPENHLRLEYEPVPGRAQQLLAGWKQFEEDLKNYRHVEAPPPVAAEPVMALPAVSIQVQGSISLLSNLDLFGRKLRAFIEGIDKNPSDDQAFANAEAAVKTLQSAQETLDAAENAALAQTASIDEMRRTVALYRDLARNTRLTLEKVVNARKDTIREEIRFGVVDAFTKHIATLNTRLGKPYMPTIPVDFAGVMKGKKTIVSLREAVNTELARGKIEANAVADRIEINLKALRELAPNHAFLFSDEAQIVLKRNDDFVALVKMRLADHQKAEEKRIAEERERIRQEEAAKAAAAAQPPAAPQPQATPAPAAAPTARKPSDDAIIGVISNHYSITNATVVQWLCDMDLKAAAKRWPKKRAA